jgi:hypothetical protein
MSGNPFYFTPAAGQTATGNCVNVCSGIQVKGKNPTFQATLSNTTSPTANVLIYGSVDGVGWTLLATLSPNGAVASDSASPQFPTSYTQFYANVQAISGASAAVVVSVGF